MGHEQGADEHVPDDANEVDGMSTRVQGTGYRVGRHVVGSCASILLLLDAPSAYKIGDGRRMGGMMGAGRVGTCPDDVQDGGDESWLTLMGAD